MQLRNRVRRGAGRMRARLRQTRRGSALFLTLVLTVSLAGLATSAIYLGGNAQILATTYDRERDLRYAAEASLAMGKSRLNSDPLVVPDTGYTTIWQGRAITGADGKPVPDITTDMYIGPTSSNTGQFGRFVSVVAVAHGLNGATMVRRLELAQESFARYAYWSNSESSGGGTIYFGGNDQVWGPLWSNDVIHMYSSGAHFHSDVGTAKYVENPQWGTFDKGYSEYQKPITLPNNTNLANLPGYAASGNESFTAPNAGTSQQALMRIEFVAADLDHDGDSTGANEGFFRVYVANTGYSAWLRGDWSNFRDNCGAKYTFGPADPPKFVPVSEHNKPWFRMALQAAQNLGVSAYTNAFRANVTGANGDAVMVQTALSQPSARCFPGGDPNLRAVDLRNASSGSTYTQDTSKVRAQYNNNNWANTANWAEAIGGDDSTFVSTPSSQGYWMKYPAAPDPAVNSARPLDAAYLFPIYRGYNTGTKGVIYVNGTTGLSGMLRGKITVYATGNVVILNDIKYTTDPSLNVCADILGVIGGQNIAVADNGVLGAHDPGTGTYRSFDDTKDLFVQGVLMALNTSFAVENYDQGPTNALGCEGVVNGRGCLYLTGGLIQQARGPVGQYQASGGATGYTKRYSYDRCALYNPPPYFPTTGRYTDNRYYEIDPLNFSAAALFHSLTP